MPYKLQKYVLVVTCKEHDTRKWKLLVFREDFVVCIDNILLIKRKF